MILLRMTMVLFSVLYAGVAQGGEFTTTDPVSAFVHSEYPLGDDYFINGNKDTDILRCLLTRKTNDFDGMALSELSIWGNRIGPWEIFKKQAGGQYVYVGTKYLTDTSCMERCWSMEYLSSGQCVWNPGWPK